MECAVVWLSVPMVGGQRVAVVEASSEFLHQFDRLSWRFSFGEQPVLRGKSVVRLRNQKLSKPKVQSKRANQKYYSCCDCGPLRTSVQHSAINDAVGKSVKSEPPAADDCDGATQAGSDVASCVGSEAEGWEALERLPTDDLQDLLDQQKYFPGLHVVEAMEEEVESVADSEIRQQVLDVIDLHDPCSCDVDTAPHHSDLDTVLHHSDLDTALQQSDQDANELAALFKPKKKKFHAKAKAKAEARTTTVQDSPIRVDTRADVETSPHVVLVKLEEVQQPLKSMWHHGTLKMRWNEKSGTSNRGFIVPSIQDIAALHASHSDVPEHQSDVFFHKTSYASDFRPYHGAQVRFTVATHASGKMLQADKMESHIWMSKPRKHGNTDNYQDDESA